MEHLCSSLVIIQQFMQMSRLRHSLFCGVTVAYYHPECGLSFTSLSVLLKHITRHLTVLTSTVLSPEAFNKCQRMSIAVRFFSSWRSSVPHLCFIHISMTDIILSDCPSAAICPMATKCNGILAGRFNLYYHTLEQVHHHTL